MNVPAPIPDASLETLRNSGALDAFVERAGPQPLSPAQFDQLHEWAEGMAGQLDRGAFGQMIEAMQAARYPQPARLHPGQSYEVESVYAPQTQATATLADPDNIEARYKFDPQRGDFFMGRCPRKGTPIGAKLDAHVAMFCPTRSGKGTGIIIPNHLTWAGSLLSIDPKGENATITARRRGRGSEYAKGMGQKVVVLDPFMIDGVPDEYRGRFNPLEELDTADPSCQAKALAIAEAMVVRTGKESEDYWKDEPVAILQTVILHVISSPWFKDRRNLLTVRELVSGGDELAAAAYAKKHPDEKKRDPTAVLFGMIQQNNAFRGVLRRKAGKLLRMLNKADRQWVGVDSGLDVQTRWLDDPAMREVVSGPSSFKLSEFKDHPQGLSVYLCLPAARMKHYNRWQRVILNLTAERMMETRGNGIKNLPTLFSLDEFASLERLETIKTGVSNFAGHGIRLMTVLQDLPQLKEQYPTAWPTFIGNSSLKIFFDMENVETAEYVQKLVGDVELHRQVTSQGMQAGSSQAANVNQVRGNSAAIGAATSQADGHSRAVGNAHADTYSQAQARGQGRSTTRSSSQANSVSLAEAMSQSRTKGSGQNSNYGTSRNSNQTNTTSDGASYDDPGFMFRGLSRGNGFIPWLFRENGTMSGGTSKANSAGMGSHASQGYQTNQSDTEGSSVTKSNSQSNTQSQSDTDSENTTDTVSRGGSDTQSVTDTDTHTTTQSNNAQLSAQRSDAMGMQVGTSEQRTIGTQDVYQVRPFFQLNELREYFARLNNKNHPGYPGLALMFLSGEAPAVVRRVNYFED